MNNIEQMEVLRNNEVTTDQDSVKLKMWKILRKQFPRGEMEYFSQMFIILVVVIVALYNLSCDCELVTFWVTILSSSLGYILPNPKRKKRFIRENKDECE